MPVATRYFVDDFERSDIGVRRTQPAPLEQLVDCLASPFRRELDAPVGKVANPTCHSQINRHRAARVTVEDALNPTGHDHPAPHDTHAISLADRPPGDRATTNKSFRRRAATLPPSSSIEPTADPSSARTLTG